MRRASSIFLILLFGLGPLSVLIDSEEANLPPCCRRHGAHHCAMAMQMAAMMRNAVSGKAPAIGAPTTCPRYPGLAAMFASPAPALTASANGSQVAQEQSRIAAGDHATPAQTPTRIHAGRGPPAATLI
ncbi:MAG: hypothetical protein ACP5E2_11800 [Terracidiphilus sp.]